MPKYVVNWQAFGGHEVIAMTPEGAIEATKDWLEDDMGIYNGSDVDGIDFVINDPPT